MKQLDKTADELHHSAEELNLKKLKGLLPLVQGHYPAGALKLVEDEP